MRIVLQSVSDEQPIDILFFKNNFGFKESDAFLSDVLKLAIGNIEVRAGISISKKVWKVVHNNSHIFLSNGPVVDILSIKNSKGKDLVPINKVRRHDNLLLTFEEGIGFITIIYSAGYSSCNLPECLKNNIISEFLKVYETNEQQLLLEKSYSKDLSNLSFLFG